MSRKEDLLNKYRNSIITGKYEIGRALPSQRELAQKEKISKSVANSIYIELEKEGLIETKIRKGTIVADWKNNPTKYTINAIINP